MSSKNHPLGLFLYPLLLLALLLEPVSAQETKKIVFVSGKPSHGPMAHEHRAGNLLLAKRLQAANLKVETVVLPKDGYPENPSVFKDAATVVIFCTGGPAHMLNRRLKEFDTFMDAGTGVVMIHWATETVDASPSDYFLSWMGGHCALNWSVNPHWTPTFDTLPKHPITRGVKPFKLNDEWYYHMRFVEGMKGVTPILSDLPSAETLKRPDGLRSGNPTVRKKVAAGEAMHVAWAYERPDNKGRGFGFTGGHRHVSWQDDSFRTIVLNAILWTAHVEVPATGVISATPTDAELKENLDDKSKKPKPQAKPEPPAQPKAPIINNQRDGYNINEAWPRDTKIPLRVSLHLLTKAIAGEKNPATQKALIKGMLKGMAGQRDVPAPPAWRTASAEIASSDDAELKRLAMNLSQLFGDEDATQNALATLEDKSEPTETRRQALRSLLAQQRQELVPILEKLVDEEALQIDAIRGFSTFDAPRAPILLLDRYVTFSPPAQRAVIDTLATRKPYAEALLGALDNGRVPADAIPAYVSRSLSGMLGESFSKRYGVKDLSENKEAQIEKYKKMATPTALAKADAAQGRLIYQKSCLACHKLYGEGGIIGPDLTGSNRADLNYLLLNIVDPSGDIQDAYQLVTVHTKNGQILTGTLTLEDDQKVELSMVGLKNTIAKSDIKKRTVTPISMMPEGLLETLKPDEVLHLFKYMQTKTQVELP